MGVAVVTRIVPSREPHDCCVTAIASYVGRSYEDVLREVVIADPKKRGRDGLIDRQIVRVLRALDTPVRLKRVVDWDEDYGLVRFADHLALLRNGLIVDEDTLWDATDWRNNHGHEHEISVFGIFVAAPS